MSLLDKLWRKQKEDTYDGKDDICVYSSKGNFGYDLKENRADKVDYQAVGRTKYAAGTPPQIYDFAQTAFDSYPIVRGSITAISDAVSSLGVKVYKVTKGKEEEDTRHIFYDVFRNPNPFQGSQEFLEQIAQSLDLFGNCFIAIESGLGVPVELYVLNTKNVAIIPDATKKIKEYKYYINGISQSYKPEEIIHLRYNDPSDPYYGSPPLTAAKSVLTLEDSRLKFINAFFQNGAVPPAVLETDGTYSPTVLNKLRGEFERLHGGVRNAGRVAILSSGLKFKSITSPLRDMDFKSLKEISTSDILNIYRIPESILGNLNQTGSEEGKAALTAFWRGCLIPRLKRIEAAINRGLKDTVFNGGRSYFRFDLKDVAALQDDKEATANYLSKLVSSSLITPNEGRSVIGQPPIEDEYSNRTYISNAQFGNQLIPTDTLNNVNANNTEKPTVKPKKDLDYALYDTARKLEELVKYLDD